MVDDFIKRSEAVEFVKNNTPSFGDTTTMQCVERSLANVPAADVVEVVRCKDCKHFTKGMAIGMCKRLEDKPILPIRYDHFCSYGERRESK